MKRAAVLVQKKVKRAARTRARIRGTAAQPRLTIFRSSTSFYAQLINDEIGKTLVSASLKNIKAVKHDTMSAGVAKAYELGKALAEKARAANVTRVVFDRGAYAYHGRVKAFADGAREGGLQF